MSNVKIIAELEEVLELDAGTLSEGSVLEDLDEWDSLAVISFIALVDEHYGHVLSGDELAKARTVGDLCMLATQASSAA